MTTTQKTVLKYALYAVAAFIVLRTIKEIADRFALATGDFYDRLTTSLSHGFGWVFGQGLLDKQGAELSGQITENATNDYAPGGRVYKQIQQQRGTPAADAAWAVVQDHLSTMP